MSSQPVGSKRASGAGNGRTRARAKSADERLRQPTEIRRRLIVAAARDVIADRGVVATTMRDIAAASDVSLGTVTYHFIGITEILVEVLAAEMEQFYTPIVTSADESGDGAAALAAVIDGFFADGPGAAQHWRLWLDFWSLSAHDSALSGWQAEAYGRWRGDILRILDRGITDGTFVACDTVGAGNEFMAIFDGLASQAFLPMSSIGPSQARAQLHSWVDRNLKTARPQPPAPHTAKATP